MGASSGQVIATQNVLPDDTLIDAHYSPWIETTTAPVINQINEVFDKHPLEHFIHHELDRWLVEKPDVVEDFKIMVSQHSSFLKVCGNTILECRCCYPKVRARDSGQSWHQQDQFKELQQFDNGNGVDGAVGEFDISQVDDVLSQR